MKKVKSGVQDIKFMSNIQSEYLNELEKYVNEGVGSTLEKLENFSKYVPRSSIARFLVKYELFKKVLDIQGCIVECGVFLGGGLMTWAQLSAILEPSNHQRQIIGFDTFSGFPSVHKEDMSSNTSDLLKEGGMSIDSYEDLRRCIKIYDMTRYFNHIKKVELVKGDIRKTVPLYVKENKHLVISLLYLDADIYEPTKVSLENFLKYMPKGSIIAFDELARSAWPGETQALKDTLGTLNSVKIKRSLFGTSISYIVLE
jgi:hypothetical protein